MADGLAAYVVKAERDILSALDDLRSDVEVLHVDDLFPQVKETDLDDEACEKRRRMVLTEIAALRHEVAVRCAVMRVWAAFASGEDTS